MLDLLGRNMSVKGQVLIQMVFSLVLDIFLLMLVNLLCYQVLMLNLGWDELLFLNVFDEE